MALLEKARNEIKKFLSGTMLKHNMEIQTAAEKLLETSPSVRVVTVCDLKGNLVYSAALKKSTFSFQKIRVLLRSKPLQTIGDRERNC